MSFCFLYTCLSAKQFACDQDKILRVLSFLRNNFTSKWSEIIFHKESTTSTFPNTIWLNFKQFFQEYFFPINTTIEAVNKLEEAIYYQGSYIVENYLDEFQSPVLEANYIDPYTLVVKFYRDLYNTIQN